MQPHANDDADGAEEIRWEKSSYSNQSGCCFEVAEHEGLIKVRDSKFRRNPENALAIEPILSFTRDEWEAFTLGIKSGEFDHL